MQGMAGVQALVPVNTAVPYYLQAGLLPRTVPGFIVPSVQSLSRAKALHEQALMFHEQKQYLSAIAAYRLSYQTYTGLLGAGHPYAAAVLYNLGDLYHTLNQPGQAEQCYRGALAVEQATLGPTHPTTLNTLKNLVSLYHDQKRYAEAEPLYFRILNAQLITLGPEHSDVAVTQNDLAVLYHDWGRPSEARAWYRQSWQTYDRVIRNNQKRQAQVAQRGQPLFSPGRK